MEQIQDIIIISCIIQLPIYIMLVIIFNLFNLNGIVGSILYFSIGILWKFDRTQLKNLLSSN